MTRRVMEAGSLVGAVGAAFTSGVAAICCIGPLALTLLGVNGMIFAAGLKPYRFYLIGASGLMLALAYWMIYRPVTVQGAACTTRTARWTRRTLWVATAVWFAAFILQFVADRIII